MSTDISEGSHQEEQTSLPRSWSLANLGEMCQLIGGGTPPRENPDFFGGEIVWLTPTEIPKKKITVISNSREKITELGLRNSSAKIVPKGSVLLTSRASIGYVAIAGCEVTTNQGFASFVCGDAIHNRYLAYWLTSMKNTLESSAKGTTFKEISKSKLRDFSIPVPPLNEQNRIIVTIEELFSQLDAGVAALEKVQAQLRRYRQAVLKSAFEGRLTQEWREHHKATLETTEVLLELINKRQNKWDSKRSRKYGNGESQQLEKLPEEWMWTRVEDIAPLIQYGSSEKANSDPSGVPIIRMGNLQGGKIDYSNLKYLARDSPDIDKFILEFGDLLFNRTNSAELVGKTAIFHRKSYQATFASYLIRVRVDETLYSPDFLSYYINSLSGRSYISSVVSQQVGQANVNGTKLANMPIPYPSFNEQRMIVSEIERLFSIIDGLEKTVRTSLEQAESLRRSILKRAFEGNLTPQQLDDEPASVLLERIKAEKKNTATIPRKRKESQQSKLDWSHQ